MIPRDARHTLQELARGYPVVAITGPRQSGKTTLAVETFGDKPYLSLEEPDQRQAAEADPRGFLARHPDGAILDEVQRCPELFSYLQGRVDRDRRPGQFILTGSQQFGILAGITQTLAGRIALLQLLPFSLPELSAGGWSPPDLDDLLFTGLYPPIYDRTLTPGIWHANYIQTYVDRDVRQLVNVRNLRDFHRFVRMAAARVGQLLNLSSLANDCGITHNTAREWLSVLEASYIVFLLQPHHQNFNKRLIKTPKLYFYDPGLAAWLLGVQEVGQLAVHPMRGALFESWVLSELLKRRYNRALPSNLYYWRDRTGNEVDVLIEEGSRLVPIEIKSGQTVTTDHLTGLARWLALAGTTAVSPRLIYGGDSGYSRSGIEVTPWREIRNLEV